MALNKRNIDVPLIGGINQNVADKLLAPPGLLKLENGRYLKEGRVDKRYGYTNLKQAINSGTLNTPRALGAVRDELLMFSADRLYTYSQADATWYDRGESVQTTTQVTSLQTSSESLSRIEALRKNGLIVTAWEEGGSFYYSVIDDSTKGFIVNKASLGTVGANTSPRIVATDNYFYIFYYNSTEMYARQIPVSAPDTSTVLNPYSTIDGDIMDAQAYGSRVYVFFKVSGSAVLRLSALDESLNVVATTTLSDTVTAAKTMAIKVFNSTEESADLIAIGWVNTSDELKVAVYTLGMVSYVSVTTITTTANIDSVLIAENSMTESTVGVFFGVSNATDSKYLTQYSTLTLSSGSATSVSTLMRSVAPVTKSTRYLNRSYFVVLHDSALQPTYFVLDTDAKVVAKFAVGQGPKHDDVTKLGSFYGTTTEFLFGGLKKSRIKSDNATLFSDLGGVLAELSFDTSKGPINTIANGDFISSGGIVRSYDGVSATEYGFHLYPEDVTATPSSGTGIPDGTYLVYAVYEWTDNLGVRHQSAPSVATSVTTGGGNNQVTVVTPLLRVTDKSSQFSNLTGRHAVSVKLYITEASGTVPYLADTEVVTGILSADTTTTVLSADPAGLTSNEILYTAGGVVENIAPPSCSYVFTHDNRIICLGLENGDQVAFSKDIKEATGAGFNEDFVLTIDPLGGKTIAGASMDNYIVIFKETATYVISGSGPNDTAAGSTYSSPQLISSDIGCKDPKSILQTPDGILVKSNKGIYILTRSLDFQYIGANVGDYNSATILSSDILKTSNELRFVTDQNKTLVYNYYFKRWAVYTTPGAIDATTWKNSEYVYLTSTKVMQESSATYLDDGSYVQTKIRTGWIKVSGLQGFQRAYRLGLIGDYHNDHTFQIKQYFDYSDIVRDTTNITASSLVNTAVFGDSATFGADDYYGGSDNDEVYQTRVHLARQKCESISIELVDTINGTNAGQGFSLEGVTLQVGGKSGIFRTSTTRTA